MAKHTSGEWEAKGANGAGTAIYIDTVKETERNYYLAEVTHGDPEELALNAALVSAGPRMLAALRAAEKLLDSVAFVSVEGDTVKPLRQIRAAIEKATTPVDVPRFG